jgi:hypothetical protein
MFTNGFINQLNKYTSYKSKKIFSCVSKKIHKNTQILKPKDNIFESEKYDIINQNGKHYKITKKIYLQIVKKYISYFRILISYNNKAVYLASTIRWLNNIPINHLECVIRTHKIPKYISKVTNLSSLRITCNQSLKIHKSIGKLTNLGGLYIFNEDNINLTNIPKSVMKLSNIRKLLVYGFKLTNIDKFIPKLTNLKFLEICKNRNVLRGKKYEIIHPLSRYRAYKKPSNEVIIYFVIDEIISKKEKMAFNKLKSYINLNYCILDTNGNEIDEL